MVRPLKFKSYRDFSKGTWNNVQSSLAPENSVKLALNLDSDNELGSLVSRMGTTMIGSQLVDNKNILGLHNYRDSIGTGDKLFAAVADGENVTIFDAITGDKSLQGDTRPTISSVSPSTSLSESPSTSISPSISPSISASLSPSVSASVSPSVSPPDSISLSRSPSISKSVSPSSSRSPSKSPSASPSRSPSVSPSASYSTNRCTGGTATASSYIGVGYEPAKAFDGTAIQWATQDPPSLPEWIKYDFGVGVAWMIAKIDFTHVVAGYVVNAFTISGSNDDSSYTTLYSGNFTNVGSATETITFTNLVRYRYIKVTINSVYGVSNTGFSEIKMYSNLNSPSSSISPSTSISPSKSPSVSPSTSISPSKSPSLSPSVSPSPGSYSPSASPSISPSVSPPESESPSISVSESPSISPSRSLSLSPSISPSVSSSLSLSASPSISPSESPSISPSVGAYAGLKTRFLTFLNSCLRLNGIDQPKAFNGSAWVSTGGAFDLDNMPQTAKYSVEFKDRVFVSGMVDKPDRVDYSGIANSESRTISWTTGNGFMVFEQEDGGGGITGLSKVPGYVLVFKKRTMKRWDGSSAYPEDMINQGAPSQEAIVTAQGICFFVNENGVWATSGGTPKNIGTYMVDKIVKSCSASNLLDAAAGTDEEHVYFSFPSVTINDETYTDVVLKYNILQQTWDVRKYPTNHRVYAKYVDVDEKVFIVFGDDDGCVQKLNIGDTDNGTDISYSLETQDLDFGYRIYEKGINRMSFLTENISKGTLMWRNTHQPEDWKSVGTVDKEVAGFEQLDLRGNYFNFKLTESVDSGQAKILGFEFPPGGVKAFENTSV